MDCKLYLIGHLKNPCNVPPLFFGGGGEGRAGVVWGVSPVPLVTQLCVGSDR